MRINCLKYFFLIVLVLVVGGCSKTPYTERPQFVVFSEGQESAMGSDASMEVKQKEKLITSGPEFERIQRIGRKIALASGRYYNWEFNLVDNDKVANAFALPGGKVFVYTGLLKLAETDSEIATVMAHEVAHVLARHGAERMSAQLAIQTGTQIGMATINFSDPTVAAVFYQAFGMGTHVGVMLPFSRHMEEEADRIGIILMVKAGYDPFAALNFWNKMKQRNDGQEPPVWLSTHPSSTSRIREIREMIPEIKAEYGKK